ncbi:MAG: hypothetical protein JWQ38_590 [Flavipsychrobacter sp.]|nr:hypothetical protein [Flavipsychrobacter sp.]
MLGNAQNITTYAGGGSSGLGDGGPATAGAIGYTAGIAVAPNGDIFIADGNNHRVRKITKSSGIITTICGTGTAGFSGDNGPASVATLNFPTWIAVDNKGNVYITDGYNNRIRKIGKDGIIRTVAGNGIAAYNGDNIPAISASLNGAQGICVDVHDNLFIVDGANPRIRKVDPSGIITTYGGTGIAGPGTDNGPATASQLRNIFGICVDNIGNIYVAETNEDSKIRKINGTTGIITTFAGTGVWGFSGDGNEATTAQLKSPFSVGADNLGNIYIADNGNNRIRKVDASGKINTIVGTGTAGFGGDGGSALSAIINRPENVVVDLCGNIFISDFGNKRVRKVTYDPVCDPIVGVDILYFEQTLSIYPNPTTEELHIDNLQNKASYSIQNILGQTIQQGTLRQGSNTIALQHIAGGIYTLIITDEQNKRTLHKIVKQ